jgi:preprotein translocase subunit SecY
MGSRVRINELGRRMLFTILVLALYLIGRSVPLFGIKDTEISSTNVQGILFSLLSGDPSRGSLMALGIIPYMNASILVMFVTAFRSKRARRHLSERRTERLQFAATLVFTILLAFFYSAQYQYRKFSPLILLHLFVFLELSGGSLFIAWLMNQNQKKGIGDMGPIFILNILSSLWKSFSVASLKQYPALILISLLTVSITIFMEHRFLRIPLMRVSVYNTHSKNSYIAYKYNPVSTMPVMFAASVLFLLQLLFRGMVLAGLRNPAFLRVVKGLTVEHYLGAAVYLVIILLMAAAFSFLILRPGEMADQMLRSGDCVPGVYPGKATRKYLGKRLFLLAILSGGLQALCMGISLGLSLHGELSPALTMIPSSLMLLVGFLSNIIREIGHYYRFDSYRFFL